MRIIGGFLLGCVFACTTIWAQAISTSQIKGTVQDPSGSVVPGADVTVTQTDTGIARNVTTGADGGYLFNELPVGPYQLQVTKASQRSGGRGNGGGFAFAEFLGQRELAAMDQRLDVAE